MSKEHRQTHIIFAGICIPKFTMCQGSAMFRRGEQFGCRAVRPVQRGDIFRICLSVHGISGVRMNINIFKAASLQNLTRVINTQYTLKWAPAPSLPLPKRSRSCGTRTAYIGFKVEYLMCNKVRRLLWPTIYPWCHGSHDQRRWISKWGWNNTLDKLPNSDKLILTACFNGHAQSGK